MTLTKYSRFVSRASRGVAYWTRVAMRDFSEDLLERMGVLKMNNAALAEAAGVSPAYITKVFRGSENFTLETMTKLAMAVGGKVRIHICEQAAQTRWLDSSIGMASLQGETTESNPAYESELNSGRYERKLPQYPLTPSQGALSAVQSALKAATASHRQAAAQHDFGAFVLSQGQLRDAPASTALRAFHGAAP